MKYLKKSLDRRSAPAVVAGAAAIALTIFLIACPAETPPPVDTTKTAGETCVADDECRGDLICTGALGTQVCSQADTGAIGSICGIDDHCTDALICGDGACGVVSGGTCTADDDCAGTLTCGAGTCSAGIAGNACNADSQCTDPLICAGADGAQVCSPAGNGAPGSACGLDTHCADPLMCVSGACGVATGGSCTADTDCSISGQICVGATGNQVCSQSGNGMSRSACGIDAHCTGAGLLCVSGACSMDADRDGTLDADDIDDDNDGLIEISTLTELHNMRYNLAGTTYDDEDADTGTGDAGITTGAPTAPTSNCTTATDGVYLCGYELTQSLDFDKDNDGSTHTNGTLDPQDDAAPYFVVANGGWEPIGSSAGTNLAEQVANAFQAIFEGNGYTIANMTISRTQEYIGFFGGIATTGTQIRNIGLTDVYVSNAHSVSSIKQSTGGLAGLSRSSAVIIASYVTGAVSSVGTAPNDEVGGLVGTIETSSAIIASYATVDVTAGSGNQGKAGGLVGRLDQNASITASYATGDANNGAGNFDHAGGLVGWNTSAGTVTASYATGNTNTGTGANDRAGRLIGGNAGGFVTASYGFGTPTGTLSGLSTRPAGITTATALTAANTAQCSDSTYTTQTTCESTSLAIAAGSWDSTEMECSAPATSPTAGVDYTTYTTMTTCTAPETKTAADTWSTWSSASNNTLNAWIFGSDTRGTCTEPTSPTSGVTYASFTTRATCEATTSPTKVAGVWVSAAPKLRYADYDGAGTTV